MRGDSAACCHAGVFCLASSVSHVAGEDLDVHMEIGKSEIRSHPFGVGEAGKASGVIILAIWGCPYIEQLTKILLLHTSYLWGAHQNSIYLIKDQMRKLHHRRILQEGLPAPTDMNFLCFRP